MFAPLTRAPHLLLRTFTGCSSVRLFRFHVAWSTHAGRGEISAFFREAAQFVRKRQFYVLAMEIAPTREPHLLLETHCQVFLGAAFPLHECKGTLMNRGFANFWQENAKNLYYVM